MESLWLVFFKLLAVAALVAVNGFFVAVEFSVVSVRRAKIEALAAQGNASAQLVHQLLKQTDKMLAAAQLGITMASLALGWIGEVTLVELIRPVFELILSGAAAGVASHVLATAIAFALITLLLLVLASRPRRSMPSATRSGSRSSPLGPSWSSSGCFARSSG